MAGAGESLSLALATTKGITMTSERFMELVTKRADVRVNDKIKRFKQAIHEALQNLTGDGYLEKVPEPGGCREANKKIFEMIIQQGTVDFSTGWPNRLWIIEEAAVEKELLGMMDEMQKALIAATKKSAENDCKSD